MLDGERRELRAQRREPSGLELDEQAAAHEVDDVAADLLLEQVARLAVPLLELSVQRSLVQRSDHTSVFCATPASSLRTSGATSVPSSSIERITCACGIVPTLI